MLFRSVSQSRYGGEGIEASNDWQKLLELGIKYLSCGQEKLDKDEEVTMDYIQDMPYIEASFMSDYNIDLSNNDSSCYSSTNFFFNFISRLPFFNYIIIYRIYLQYYFFLFIFLRYESFSAPYIFPFFPLGLPFFALLMFSPPWCCFFNLFPSHDTLLFYFLGLVYLFSIMIINFQILLV